jgi:DhnA family fructose-bisphosphate aldolase class Ia
LTERIAGTGADAVVVTAGVLRIIAPVLGGLGVILRIDGGFTQYASASTDYGSMVAPEDAVAMGADAAIVFTFVGTKDEARSVQRLGQTAIASARCGLPLVAEVLAPGILRNHFGADVFPKPGKNADIGEETKNVCRIAAEAGADIVKTRYTGDVRQFRSVVETCGAPVIVAGGPKTSGTDEALLRLTHDCVAAGASGIIFGRNVWQHPKMEKLIHAICAVVHEGETVTRALALLR